MTAIKTDSLTVRREQDVVAVRQLVRKHAQEIGFGLVDQTKMVTAASELARNTVVYGGGGELKLDWVSEDARRGLRLTFSDEGPGILDIELAMKMAGPPAKVWDSVFQAPGAWLMNSK